MEAQPQHGVREFVNKSAASAASPDYVKYQAVLKRTAGAAFPEGGCANTRLDRGLKSTRIKDAGIAIRHSRGRILFYTAGSRNGLERVVSGGPGHKKEVAPKKNTLFCYRKIC